MTETRLKMLALDIETAPLTAYAWGLWDQNIGINQVIDWGRIICFSAQWYGSKTVIFKSEYHDGADDMFETLHQLLDEADVVTGWNSDAFDIPWIEGELQLRGYQAPSPFHKLDLMKHFRRHSKFASKKLAVVSERFLSTTKVTNPGMQMWRDCIEVDTDPEVKRKAWNLMRKYAKKDTALLWPIFESVKSWVKLPLPVVISDDEEARCRFGHTDIQWRGWSRTQTMSYRRFQCNECGAWGRSIAPEHKFNHGHSRAL